MKLVLNLTFFPDASQEARLAQSVEHGTLNPRVVGSSPTLGGIFFPATGPKLQFSVDLIDLLF